MDPPKASRRSHSAYGRDGWVGSAAVLTNRRQQYNDSVRPAAPASVAIWRSGPSTSKRVERLEQYERRSIASLSLCCAVHSFKQILPRDEQKTMCQVWSDDLGRHSFTDNSLLSTGPCKGTGNSRDCFGLCKLISKKSWTSQKLPNVANIASKPKEPQHRVTKCRWRTP